MRQVNIRTLRTDLARIIAEAEEGETVTITRDGHAVAALVPLSVLRPPRVHTTERWDVGKAQALADAAFGKPKGR